MDMRIPPLEIKIMIESNPPKSGILVRRLAVGGRPTVWQSDCAASSQCMDLRVENLRSEVCVAVGCDVCLDAVIAWCSTADKASRTHTCSCEGRRGVNRTRDAGARAQSVKDLLLAARGLKDCTRGQGDVPRSGSTDLHHWKLQVGTSGKRNQIANGQIANRFVRQVRSLMTTPA